MAFRDWKQLPVSQTIFLTACATCIVILYALYQTWIIDRVRRRLERQWGCKPLRRAPQKDPILGIDIFITQAKAAGNRKYLQTVQQWFQDVAPTFGVRLMGDDMIFTNEPRNIQAMLVTHFKAFEIGERRRHNSRQLLGIGIFNADGKDWEHGRALVRPNFSRKQVSDLHIFERHTQALKQGIVADGSPVEMQDWFFRFVSSHSLTPTLDVATEYLFGQSSGVLARDATDRAKTFAWAFGLGIDGISQRTRLGKLAALYYDKDYTKACRAVHEYVEPMVAKAMTQAASAEKLPENDERYTLLVQMAREGTEPRVMRDQVLNVLVAARDTSACLISAAFFRIGQHPDLVKLLRKDVEALGGALPTYDDIKNMSYLNYFIKECLRMHPPVPLNARVSRENTFLPLGGGPDGQSPVYVPKGTLCVYQIYSMHRRKDLWGHDAEVFNPSRWEKVRPTFEYLPFNAGPRICPGQQFAITETAYLIIRFLQEYSSIQACEEGVTWYENLTLTCSTGPGVWLKFCR
ncbi:cytochrome P450 [Lophiotrema nucula]|uniref:Cytochrome P450 n=1 Tax=Lophiotrema nucula TaxID=690887 RepID=A0A6A5Z343_9PLEO|nr:cytochrome P450 [Lophiotrema nucula]